MNHVRIGVIGAGVMGERHCRVCLSLPRVNFVGISDIDIERGQSVADRYGTTFFSDFRDLLSQVNAVIIAAPTDAHYSLASECLERGVHVLVEKPITETVAQASELVQLANQRGLVLQVGHIERFNPVFGELKNVIEGMTLVHVNVRRLSPFDTSKTDVDVIHDLMIHDLDLIMNLVDCEFDGISASGRSILTEVVDHAVAFLSFRDGPIATLAASRVTEQKVREIEIVSKGAYIQADLLNKSISVHRRTFPRFLDGNSMTKYHQESIIERIYVPASEPLMLELQHFVDCVRQNQPCQVPGYDGLRALELAEIVVGRIGQQESTMPAILKDITNVYEG